MAAYEVTGDNIKIKKLNRRTRTTRTVFGTQEYLIKNTLIKYKIYKDDKAFIQKVKPKDVQGKFGKPYKELSLNFEGAVPGHYFWLTKPLKVTPDTYNNNYVVDINELRNSCTPYRKVKAKTPVRHSYTNTERRKPASYTHRGERDHDFVKPLIIKPKSEFGYVDQNGLAAKMLAENPQGFTKVQFEEYANKMGNPTQSADARLHTAGRAMQHDLEYRYGKGSFVFVTPEQNGGKFGISQRKYTPTWPFRTGLSYKVIGVQGKEEQLVAYE